MYNKTKLLTLTTTILMLASVVAIGSSLTAEASNGKMNTFESGTVTFFCYGNLDTALTSRYIPCDEFTDAAKTWSKITNVSITEADEDADQQIDVSAAKLSSRVIAVMQATETEKIRDSNGKRITYNTEISIKFNSLKEWGHKNLLDKYFRFDLQTVALHELGHALSLKHSGTSDLMKRTMSTQTNETTIPSHDKSVVRSQFAS